jgi:ribosomal protein L11 methylase PrmA
MNLQRLSARTAGLVLGLALCSAPAPAQAYGESGDVPYVPTPQEIVEAMLDLGKANGKDVVFDLGCGDGRIVVTAARKFGARGTGVDINPERIKEANENAHSAGVRDKVRFVNKDLFDMDLTEASLVTLYLLPEVNVRLRPKLLRELRSGSRIVSHSFDMDEWKPDKTVEVNGKTLHLWIVSEAAKKKFGGS